MVTKTADRSARPRQVVPIYPLYLTNLDQVITVVVGGGTVGQRKVKALLDGHAVVKLIAPQVTPQLQQWAAEGRLVWIARCYQTGDLADAFLAFAVTDQRGVNQQIAAEAHARKILCNVADVAEEGNFHTPAVHRQDDLVLAVEHQQNSHAV
ncbi:MAG: NAD(P)-dependent oxidoreductase [Caldilineaceae bacterium]